MSEQIREQVSAFLDGELPGSETELLLKRLTRDGELRESFGRYALIGEALRGSNHALLRKGFESRVNLAIDGEPVPVVAALVSTRSARWWRPLAGAAVVTGVAVVAVTAMQHRSPLVTASIPTAGPTLAANREAISYTVPTAPVAAPGPMAAARPSGRLTNYMFAHSRYSYGLGQRGVLTDLLIQDDAPATATVEAAKAVPVRVAP
jgi:sigma-E factor negative regulatory protein RseA